MRDVAHAVGAFALTMPAVFLALGVATAIAAALSGKPPDPLAHDTLRSLVEAPRDAWWWLLVAGVVVAAPVYEEVLYRGLLQTAVRSAVRSPWMAVLATSAVFTLMHVGSIQEYEALVGLFVLSVALGLAFERTGRIAVPALLHGGFNALMVALST